MKIISFIPFCLFLYSGILSAGPALDDYIFKTNIGSINWSRGVITVQGKGLFPMVIKDPNDPQYDPQGLNQVRNRAEAKLTARNRAMEDALRNAAVLIMGIQVGEGKKLRDHAVNPVIMGKINAFINGKYTIRDLVTARDPSAERDSRTGSEILTLTLNYQIFGEKGLLSLNDSDEFSENFINFDYEHFTNSSLTNGKVWDGLVISAPFLNVTPALAPKIFSEDGGLIYDASKVLMEEAVKTGVIGYSKTPFNQPKEVSLSFYHCTALSTKKFKGTDIVISKEDADQILSRAKNVDNLKHCRVVILAPDGDK
jgi:hypothetical protein